MSSMFDCARHPVTIVAEATSFGSNPPSGMPTWIMGGPSPSSRAPQPACSLGHD